MFFCLFVNVSTAENMDLRYMMKRGIPYDCKYIGGS